MQAKYSQFLKEVAESGMVPGYNIPALRKEMSEEDKATRGFSIMDSDGKEWVRVNRKDGTQKNYFSDEERTEYLKIAKDLWRWGYVEQDSETPNFYRITPK